MSIKSERKQLSLAGEAKLGKILAGAEYWLKAYISSSGALINLLGDMGTAKREAEKFVLDLAKVDMDSGRNFGVLPATMGVLETLRGANVPYSGRLKSVLFNSIAMDSDWQAMGSSEGQQRITRPLIRFSEALKNDPGRISTDSICWELVETIDKKMRGGIGIDSRTNQIHQTGMGKTVDVQSDFFSSRRGKDYSVTNQVQMVRVGEIVFLDESHSSAVTPEMSSRHRGRVVYVPELGKTEFRGSLGYWTSNTIASMTAADFRGRTILDCGTGSGLLSLAALRLGASAVLGVDFDLAEIEKARELLPANGDTDLPASVKFIKEDLRNRERVVGELADLAQGRPIGVISNLGYWPDYLITNITNISLLDLMTRTGLQPDVCVSGGYYEKQTRVYEGEPALLKEMGIKADSLPQLDHKADKKLLENLGFKQNVFSQSEPKNRSGVQAGSLVAHRIKR